MIRFELQSFRSENASDAAMLLRHIADKLEEGYTSGIEYDAMSEGAKYNVDELCEFCHGERFIEGENGKRKPCFNCNEPDHERDTD